MQEAALLNAVNIFGSFELSVLTWKQGFGEEGHALVSLVYTKEVKIF